MKNLILWVRNLPLEPLCLTFLGAMLWPEMELLAPALPALKSSFGISEGEVQQLLSINFIGFMLGVLLVGPLCDSLGRKKICILGALAFLLASLGAALSPDFLTLMIMRFLQGLAVTAPIVAGSTLLLEITKGDKQIFWMSLSSSLITLCMALSPLFGSWINGHFGYKANLWAIFFAALVGIIPVIFFVKESLSEEKRSTFDPKSVLSSYGSLLTNRPFMGMIFVVSGLPAAYWVYTGVSSLYLVDHLGIDPDLFGLYQGPVVGSFAFLSICMGHIHRRLGLKRCLMGGFVMMLIGVSAMIFLELRGIESASLTTLFMMFFVGGMVPVNCLLFPQALNMLPAKLQGSGQSLIQALRLFLASIGTFSLGLFYQGPFLPVSLILVTAFVCCWLLLWRLRRILDCC